MGRRRRIIRWKQRQGRMGRRKEEEVDQVDQAAGKDGEEEEEERLARLKPKLLAAEATTWREDLSTSRGCSVSILSLDIACICHTTFMTVHAYSNFLNSEVWTWP